MNTKFILGMAFLAVTFVPLSLSARTIKEQDMRLAVAHYAQALQRADTTYITLLRDARKEFMKSDKGTTTREIFSATIDNITEARRLIYTAAREAFQLEKKTALIEKPKLFSATTTPKAASSTPKTSTSTKPAF